MEKAENLKSSYLCSRRILHNHRPIQTDAIHLLSSKEEILLPFSSHQLSDFTVSTVASISSSPSTVSRFRSFKISFGLDIVGVHLDLLDRLLALHVFSWISLDSDDSHQGENDENFLWVMGKPDTFQQFTKISSLRTFNIFKNLNFCSTVICSACWLGVKWVSTSRRPVLFITENQWARIYAAVSVWLTQVLCPWGGIR